MNFTVTGDAQAFNVFYSEDSFLGAWLAAYAEIPPPDTGLSNVPLGPDPLHGFGPGQYSITLPITHPGSYYWEVYGMVGGYGNGLLSGMRSIDVIPAAPDRLAVTVSKQDANWANAGKETTRVATTPWANVTMRLRSSGRTLSVKRAQANSTGAATLTSTWTCLTSGSFYVSVIAGDGNGHTLARDAAFS